MSEHSKEIELLRRISREESAELSVGQGEARLLALLVRQARLQTLLLEEILGKLTTTQSGFTITQGDHMPITGIVVGATGVFQETPLPVGAVIPPGTIPVWSVNVPDVTLVPSSDGTQVSATVVSTSTLTTFNLTVANQDGSFPTTVAVPILPVVNPPQTGFQINQLS